jgi:hypothetical protein
MRQQDGSWGLYCSLLAIALQGGGSGGDSLANVVQRHFKQGNPMFNIGSDLQGRGNVKDIDKMAI